MKRLISLDDFGLNEASVTPEKQKFKYEISDNMRKVAKMQKTLIDVAQLLTEMSDEITALKLNFDIESDSLRILNNMKGNIDNMVDAVKRKKERGHHTGMIDNITRLNRNLEALKKTFVAKKEAKLSPDFEP